MTVGRKLDALLAVAAASLGGGLRTECAPSAADLFRAAEAGCAVGVGVAGGAPTRTAGRAAKARARLFVVRATA